MRKYLLPILLIGFWGCQESNDNLELIYSSISDGDILENYSDGVLLKFSKEISHELFDALSVENFGGELVIDTIDIDSVYYSEHMFYVNSSNFIKLNNQPQSFIYDSDNSYCLLFRENNEAYPGGTGEGFMPDIGNNKLVVGNDEINFVINSTSDVTFIPNPYLEPTGEAIGVRFSNLSYMDIIDIYQVNNEAHIRRFINNNEENNNLWWDLLDFNFQRVDSGIYSFRVGTDTTSSGYLNYFTESYFSVINLDD
tara:strand:- start:78 stop:839 length:762 start_codon:yes stop_codon:yes gene_type:complete